MPPVLPHQKNSVFNFSRFLGGQETHADALLFAHDSHDLCAALAAAILPLSLIILWLECDLDGDLDSFVVESRSIHLLLYFVNLTSVYIHSMLELDPGNETALDMARAWPRLRNLELCGHHCTDLLSHVLATSLSIAPRLRYWP
ncbi:hypothetical protein C8J57DRAFT_1511269 [Mycena rebaudengoi]|jgi:hypothetical protein|nr:hypothetical protein C8J57DRAFT_1511269 [Mycena rebaudengoi]